MTWFKVDDKFRGNRKVRRLGRAKVRTISKVAAVGIWTLCGTWAADNTSDGWVPEEEVDALDPDHTIAALLVKANLWVAGENDGEPGWWFVNWDQYQPMKAELEAEREAWRLKKAAQRAGKKGLPKVSPGDTDGDSTEDTPRESTGESTSESPKIPGTRPVPSRPVLPSGHLGGEGPEPNAHERPPTPLDPRRCLRHQGVTDPPNCGPCADARRRADTAGGPATPVPRPMIEHLAAMPEKDPEANARRAEKARTEYAAARESRRSAS